MAHSDPVSTAIQAALHDIDLLRPLAEAPDKYAANAILTAYKRNRRHLGLEEPYLEEFWISLRDGEMNHMKVPKLVEYLDCLLSGAKKGGGRIEEWTP
jgi:hypothetical protein